MLRNREGVREAPGERRTDVVQVVDTGDFALRVGERYTGTPPQSARGALVRTLELEGHGVVPGFPVLGGVDEVVEAVRGNVEALAAGAVRIQADVRPVVGEQVNAAGSFIGQGAKPRPHHVTHTEAPLRVLWGLDVVVEQVRLGQPRAVDQRVEYGGVGGEVGVV